MPSARTSTRGAAVSVVSVVTATLLSTLSSKVWRLPCPLSRWLSK
ncbi:MAG: hypothetical protein PUD23_04980 [Prevotella sp.]|nr:hypothetical protein [Prevotella sp.]